MGRQSIGFAARGVARAATKLLVATKLLIAAALMAGCAGLGFSTPEPVTLTYVYLDQGINFQALAEEFQAQHANITIELRPVAYADAERDFVTQAASADALRLPAMLAASEEIGGTLLPLDGLIATDSDFPQSDLYAGSLEGLRRDGKQIGLPAGINPFVMYYLPAKLARVGVSPPAPDWTLEDFFVAASAVHNVANAQLGSEEFAYGFCSHPQFGDVALISYMFGGGLFDSLVQISRPTLDQPANVAAVEWYTSLRRDYGLIPDSRQTSQVYELIFRRGCGFWIDWLDSSTFGQPVAQSEPLPLPRHVAAVNIAQQEGYFLLARSEHPEEAFRWIRFLMDQPDAAGRLIPPRRSTVESDAYLAAAPPAIAAVARSLPAETVVLSIDMLENQRFGRVLQLFGNAVQQVFNDQQSAQSALEAAQQQAESLFR